MLNELNILSIDAWNSPEGWDWNAWYEIATIPPDCLNYSPRKLLKTLRDMGILSPQSVGKMAIIDDEYNLVIIDRRNKEPLIAIEYGNAI
jgi:hypothetical protein